MNILLKKKLLLFTYDFPPLDGGISRLCYEIAKLMPGYYSEVIVLTTEKTGHQVPYDNLAAKVKLLPRKRIKCEIAAINYLLHLNNKDQYDVLCGLWHPEAAIALLCGFKKVFILAHGTELLYGSSNFRKLLWLPVYANLILQKASIVIANSNYTANLVRHISKKSVVNVLPLAVNHSFFKPLKFKKEDAKFRLCSVSRIQRFKGHDFVLKTIADLPTEYKEKLKYHIAGSGSYLHELKKLAEDLGLREQVIFHGFISDDELPSFYNQADVFILCTREEPASTQVEGFGLVFLEAQACGTPVIGTDTGGITDAVSNMDGGWLIEQDNTQQLSNLLIKLMDNDKLIADMGNKARQKIERGHIWGNYCLALSNLTQRV